MFNSRIVRLVNAGPFFDDGNRLVHRAASFEETQGDDRVRQVGDVDRILHRTEQAMGRNHQHGDDSLLV